MKCEIGKKRIHLYYENLLEVNERKQIEQHLKGCIQCREELEYLEFLNKQFYKLDYVKIDPKLKTNLELIEKRKFSVLSLIKDIYQITFRNSESMFHINDVIIQSLKEKYPENILRWVFYC